MTVEFAGVAKARQLREYFARHGRIYIVVNATGDDVIVPEHLHGDPALRLILNVRMPQTIIIRDDTLESEFSFSGNLFHCCIPMHAIWATYVPEQKIENGILWEDDVPETIRAVVKAVRGMREDNSESAMKDVPDTDSPEPENHQKQRGRRVGHLRVIK
ncbi:MAG: ClpXP protease specificity-enhancing factor SspB [Mariprofundaceae bacterium]|nr:ClpXP protease specificity-enhancing factor SspB [Mariprofundaceae bacterium]